MTTRTQTKAIESRQIDRADRDRERERPSWVDDGDVIISSGIAEKYKELNTMNLFGLPTITAMAEGTERIVLTKH